MIGEPRLKKLNTAAYILLVILTCECVVGSSGRWLEFGSLSIRMVLFVAAFFTAIPFVIQNFKELIRNKVVLSILIFFLFVCFSLNYGYLRGNNGRFILADATSMLFLIIIPCYLVICNTQHRIETLIKYASLASVILAAIVIIFHFVLLFLSSDTEKTINYAINYMGLGGLFNFGDGIYRIYFKSSVCFILPFLYNLTLLIRDKKEDKKTSIWPYIFMTISLTAIVLTYTRSIWLGIFVGVIIFLAININKYKTILKSIAISIAGFLMIVMISWASYGFEGILSNAVNRVLLTKENIYSEISDFKDMQLSIEIESENIRSERLEAIFKQINNNWVFGGGLGQSLDVRRYAGKIEYTYLDILGKMGIFGFLSFLSVLFMPFYYVYKKYGKKAYPDSMGIMMGSVICVYVASMFNPFISSPIGFSLYAVLAASIIAKDVETPICNNTFPNTQSINRIHSLPG